MNKNASPSMNKYFCNGGHFLLLLLLLLIHTFSVMPIASGKLLRFRPMKGIYIPLAISKRNECQRVTSWCKILCKALILLNSGLTWFKELRAESTSASRLRVCGFPSPFLVLKPIAAGSGSCPWLPCTSADNDKRSAFSASSRRSIAT